jgi:lipoprotein-anchoring transpeptidase ErfK/SrfK
VPLVTRPRSVGLRLIALAIAAASVTAGCVARTAEGQNGWVRRVPSSSAPSARPKQSAPRTDAAEAETARPARPAVTPCAHNQLARYVFVSLHQQHMWMCAGHRVARDTAITSGMRGAFTHTPTGRYRIQGLNRNTTLTLNTGATYPVKYWIPFDAPLFGFHDSPWQRFPYGSPLYATRGSHGCIHMPLKAIRFLYHWADIGTTVRIQR